MANRIKECNYKLPKSALAIYVKLYCKTKGKNFKQSNILTEATKSWVSLSKTEKQHFYNLYEKYKAELKKNFATNLKNIQLYMKKKHDDTIRSCKYNEDLPIEQDDITDSQSCEATIEVQEINNKSNNNTPYSNTNENSKIQIENQPHSDQIEPSPEQHVSMWMPEPAPPLSSSMELFEIVKNSKESTQTANWNDLSKTQKQRYQRAVAAIKNEYIKHYRAYLEQLTSEQLFQYYKSKF